MPCLIQVQSIRLNTTSTLELKSSQTFSQIIPILIWQLIELCVPKPFHQLHNWSFYYLTVGLFEVDSKFHCIAYVHFTCLCVTLTRVYLLFREIFHVLSPRVCWQHDLCRKIVCLWQLFESAVKLSAPYQNRFKNAGFMISLKER